jgi:hypothetical protein
MKTSLFVFIFIISFRIILLTEVMEFKGRIVFDTEKSDGQYKKTASNHKLKSLYPEFQFTSIQQVLVFVFYLF